MFQFVAGGLDYVAYSFYEADEKQYGLIIVTNNFRTPEYLKTYLTAAFILGLIIPICIILDSYIASVSRHRKYVAIVGIFLLLCNKILEINGRESNQ